MNARFCKFGLVHHMSIFDRLTDVMLTDLVVHICMFLYLCLDYIASPCSQEDDVHNVQSVIDSLSLDYLQISLSHITGWGKTLICINEM